MAQFDYASASLYKANLVTGTKNMLFLTKSGIASKKRKEPKWINLLR